MRLLLALAVLAWSVPAAADLYRWVDPESGSVKFSSYPPPWYGDETQRRVPLVEHIPASNPAARPALGPGGALESGDVAALDLERRALLAQIAAGVARPAAERPQDLQRQVQVFARLSARMDALDPQGAAARRAEVEELFQKLGKPAEKR